MLIKVDGMVVGSYDTPMDLDEMSNLPEVVEALEGRVVVEGRLHPSTRSINLTSAPPTDHLPHVKRQKETPTNIVLGSE